MAARCSLDRQFAPFRQPDSHSTRTEHVQNEEHFSVRREPATVMLDHVPITGDTGRTQQLTQLFMRASSEQETVFIFWDPEERVEIAGIRDQRRDSAVPGDMLRQR